MEGAGSSVRQACVYLNLQMGQTDGETCIIFNPIHDLGVAIREDPCSCIVLWWNHPLSICVYIFRLCC